MEVSVVLCIVVILLIRYSLTHIRIIRKANQGVEGVIGNPIKIADGDRIYI